MGQLARSGSSPAPVQVRNLRGFAYLHARVQLIKNEKLMAAYFVLSVVWCMLIYLLSCNQAKYSDFEITYEKYDTY